MLRHFIMKLSCRRLKECGIKAVIFDKDNTLTPPYSFAMDHRTESTVRLCQDLFGYDMLSFSQILQVYIVIGGDGQGSDDDKDHLQADAIESELKINVIRHHKKKPDGLLETISLWPSIKEEEVMMVGDRYLTDIYGGNVYGLLTVCVRIITRSMIIGGAIFVTDSELDLL